MWTKPLDQENDVGATELREVVLRLRHPDNWISELTKDSPTRVRVLDCRLTANHGGIRQIISIKAPEEDLLQFVTGLKNNKHIAAADIVRTRHGSAVGTVIIRDAILCSSALGSSIFCRTCLFTSDKKADGTVDWRLALDGRQSLKELLERIRSLNLRVKITRFTSIAEKEGLTRRQEQVLRTAFEKGFFDYPRKITLRQLAVAVNVSPSSISEMLRRAHKRIVNEHLHASTERF